MRNEVENALAVTNVEFVVRKARDKVGESFLAPASVALWAKKCRALVVVHPMNCAALAGEKKLKLQIQ